MKHYLDLGQQAFGENYVQEALIKKQRLNDARAVWHFIGRVQSNKIKELAQHFDWVQTLTQRKQVEKLSQEAARCGRVMQVCLQYRCQDRQGVKGAELFTLADEVMASDGLILRGLLVMPGHGLDQVLLRKTFSEARDVFLDMQRRYGQQLDTLSMGMSGDYMEALEIGATQVRIGSFIMGEQAIMNHEKQTKVTIVGAGRIGVVLLKRLLHCGYQCTVLEHRQENLDRLPPHPLMRSTLHLLEAIEDSQWILFVHEAQGHQSFFRSAFSIAACQDVCDIDGSRSLF